MENMNLNVARELNKIAKSLIAGVEKKAERFNFNGKKVEFFLTISTDIQEDILHFHDMETLFGDQNLYKIVKKYRGLFQQGLKDVANVYNTDEMTYLRLKTNQKVTLITFELLYKDDAINHKEQIYDLLKKQGISFRK